MNVLNTLTPNSVIEAVIEIRKNRDKKFIDEAPMILTNEFVQLLEDFSSISND